MSSYHHVNEVDDTINIESNVSHILALSSIFLIQREKYHPDLIGVFTEEKLKTIFDDQCKRFKIKKYIRTCINNTDIITRLNKNVKNDVITREEGIVQAYQLGFTPSPLSITTTTTTTTPISTNLPKNVNNLLKCVAKMIEKLPNQDVKEDVSEFELCQRYIDPILSGLFDDPDKGILFRWTSVTNEESKNGFITKQRPDSTITSLDGLYYGPSLGFVEVKSAKRGHDKSAISNDLVRLGLLTKNAIDRSNANDCFGIQVIAYPQQPQFLWTFDKELIENPDQRTIIQIIQYILTDFSGKCYRVGKTLDNYERTFFIDHVVPIFQNIGDQ